VEARDWHRRYDPGVPPSIAYEGLTLPQALRRSAARFPGRAALVYQGTTVRYAELQRLVDRAASALAGLGVERGTRVAIQLPNTPQAVIAFCAALSLGAQAVFTNPIYTDDEIEHQWQDAGVSHAFVLDAAWRDRIPRMAPRVPVQHWIVCSLPDLFPWWKRPFARRALARLDPPLVAPLPAWAGATSFRRLLAGGRAVPRADAAALDEIAMLQYTGGTTGRAKGAMLTHRNLSAGCQQIKAWLSTLEEGREVFLAALPYFHVFGLSVCLDLPLWTGATIVLVPDPRDTAGLLELIQSRRVTVLALVPQMFAAIGRLRDLERYDLRSVKGCFSGSAPLTRETLERFEQLTGGRIFEGYGLTETTAATHVNPVAGERRIGTVGLPLPDTDVRLAGEAGAGQPADEGELLIRGPQVMAGYWRRPDETAAVLRDGWFATGDLAARDADGYFRIVGRKKEMIVVGGYKVYPDEVDHVFAAHPAVLEAATIGVPDPVRGETVKTFVVRRPGAVVAEADLLAYARQHLAAYKVPRELEFRASLPRSSVLKVLRRELLRQELARREELAAEQRPA
jgi:long-chain acyl-CoA synthetase